MDGRGTLFREIHKNTWLKRVIADNRKIPVGIKKPEKYWVVFCVHDDCEALLEGYTEPRQAASHSPDWTVSLQTTLHISHTLVPSENEYEFVIALAGETLRFNASSWEIMQEWVDTLRLKLREMKILSPKENLYSKLPEVRPPLLPTRDPTRDPLPLIPPVPAAIVPGVIVNTTQTSRTAVVTAAAAATVAASTSSTTATVVHQVDISSSSSSSEVATSTNADTNERNVSSRRITPPSVQNTIEQSANTSAESSSSFVVTADTSNAITTTSIASTSNTLIKMLYPLPNFSHQSNELNTIVSDECENESSFAVLENQSFVASTSVASTVEERIEDESIHSLARTFATNVLFDPNTSSSSKRSQHITTISNGSQPATNRTNDLADSDTISVDSSVYGIYPTPEPLVIPRPQTTRTSSSKSKKVDSVNEQQMKSTSSDDTASTNITIIQVSSANVKEKSPPTQMECADQIETTTATTTTTSSSSSTSTNYMNNVQIIPSNYSSTEQNSIVTVQVTNDTNTPGQINDQLSLLAPSSKTLPATNKNGIITAAIASDAHDDVKNGRKFGAVTNISIGEQQQQQKHQGQLQPSPPVESHYEQVFIMHTPSTASISTISDLSSDHNKPKINRIKVDSAHRIDNTEARPSTSTASSVTLSVVASSSSSAAAVATASSTANTSNADSGVPNPVNNKSKDAIKNRSVENNLENDTTLLCRRPLLSRGLTEAVIMRPSRKDVNMLLNRINPQGNHCSPSEFHSSSQPPQRDSAEQRKRSSSTSDTQRNRSRTNNNNVPTSGNAYMNNNNNNSEFRRAPVAQPNNQPFRPNVDVSLRSSGRLTLREQQVMQLRREMMHPGGVRIQLRRKDCTGSIAFVDAFGAAWISGWKQKEHPMLYNALHIGDQIISIGGITVTNAKEANKIINNSTGQFIEFIIRRVPFGRVYAIRREIDRQCLGLIRDGNTATIVDVVPNSLSARHGLPPKAQSCDGLSLTFWVLTEINGRPLNLFFKENEVRDRLNAVGRDISILVQPSDLICKLKKQLKSMRNHKDYIVQ